MQVCQLYVWTEHTAHTSQRHLARPQHTHRGSAGTGEQRHCVGTATLGAGAGGPLGLGMGAATFWLLSADRRSSRSV